MHTPQYLVLALLALSLNLSCSAGDRMTLTDGGGADAPLADSGMTDGSTEPQDSGTPDAAVEECGDEEVCGDGLDNDCDGMIEEGCYCIPGERQGCYGGPISSRGVGACQDGEMMCTDAVEFGTWSECVGAVLPGEEVCDPEGVDEDCDGAANEGCECSEGETMTCGSDVGVCVAGMQECVDGRFGPCVGAVPPGMETCNGLDDDCDGMTDEGLSRSCGTDVGECRMGTQSCVDGEWETVCLGARAPSDEICDERDNDCDSRVDEELNRPCGSSTGECTMGMQSCISGAWSECTGALGPMLEDCNGRDDDCDGPIDEALSRTCGSDIGRCRSGTETCGSGAWGMCTGSIAPGSETCDGLSDEDCDGLVDEGCDCTTGSSRPCGTSTGECTAGREICDATGRWGACTGAVGGMPETCDNLDNDCDRRTDEGLARPCGSDVGICRRGTETCGSGSWGACLGGVSMATEACDGLLDEDCDGVVDEGCGCVTGSSRSCGTGVGECVAGTQLCDASGTWGACTGSVGPSFETCDNRDNDCDGSTDESLTRGCGTDVGVCMRGTETCARGSWGSCLGGVGATMELCDAARLDEDCDGLSNEGCACVTGETRPCGTSVGACTAGTETCDAAGSWGTCVGAIGPTAEVCDGIDNDCDGAVDEGDVCIFTDPLVMCPAAVTAEVLSTVSLVGGGSDPDGGAVTYLWTVLSRPAGSTAEPSSPTSASTNFTLDAGGDFVLQLCVTDDEGVTTCCTVNLTSTVPGGIHVEVFWSTSTGDVDAHLLSASATPTASWWSTNDCYYANPSPEWGAAGADGNPTLDVDDTDGNGPENITIDVNPESGTFTVGIHYFCDRSISDGSATGTSVPTDGTVLIYCDGSLIATYTGLTLDSTDRWRDVAEIDYPSCRVRRLSTVTWGSDRYPSSFTSPRHCEIPCSRDSDCPPSERCVRVTGGGSPRNICYP